MLWEKLSEGGGTVGKESGVFKTQWGGLPLQAGRGVLLKEQGRRRVQVVAPGSLWEEDESPDGDVFYCEGPNCGLRSQDT